MSDIRAELGAVAHAFAFSTEQLDRVGSAVRDILVANGLDPSDRQTLEVGLVTSYHALCIGVNCGAFGMPLAMLWANCEAYRRWLDGDAPIVSISDMLNLPGIT